jgi:hypothetical protein
VVPEEADDGVGHVLDAVAQKLAEPESGDAPEGRHGAVLLGELLRGCCIRSTKPRFTIRLTLGASNRTRLTVAAGLPRKVQPQAANCSLSKTR